MTTTFKGRWNVSGSNVCFIKIRTKLSSVLLLCLVRIFLKQTYPLLISTGFLKYPLELKKKIQLELKKNFS